MKLTDEQTRELKGCIQFWESKLFHDKYLMEPATIALIEITVKFLKGMSSENLR